MEKLEFDHHTNYVPPAMDIPFGTMIRFGGHQKTCRKSYFFNGLKRGLYETVLWQYTISGCGMVEFDGKKFPVNPGEAFLLLCPEKHLYYLPDKPGNWEFLYLCLEGCETLRIAGELRKLLPPVSAAYASRESVALARQLIRQSSDHELKTPFAASKLTYDFMMSLLAAGQHNAMSGDIILQMHQFCTEHLKDDIGVGDMAQFAGYSRSHFCRIFRELSGQSPHEYLLALRIRTAVRLLQNGSLNIKEVAAGCGFAETGYFCKVFRRFTGNTPGVFRRKDPDTEM